MQSTGHGELPHLAQHQEREVRSSQSHIVRPTPTTGDRARTGDRGPGPAGIFETERECRVVDTVDSRQKLQLQRKLKQKAGCGYGL
jgi:hypothetical protein